MNLETVRIITRRKYIKYTSKYRKKKINNFNFTIISNNCWGGFIYQSYNLPYLTPTVGLYFMAEDYIIFLENFEKCLSSKIIFIDSKDSKYFETLKNSHKYGEYPIGIIDLGEEKIEIHFLHYTSQTDALNKWDERKQRINKDNLIIKFCDQNEFKQEYFDRFMKLPFKNKLFFCSKDLGEGCTFIKECANYPTVLTSYEPFGKSKYLNVNKYINNISKDEGEGYDFSSNSSI